MPQPALRTALAVASLLIGGSLAVDAHAGLTPVAEGKVRFYQSSRASFDDYTDDPTPAEQQWMRDHYVRMQVYTSYFDSRLSWFPNAWVYRDAYAIFPNSNTFAEHPDWVLRDAAGNMLFIPYDCENGTCPQFAGDFGNPDFRAHWIARATELIATGYIGLWIDDVNLKWRISDGNGDNVTPVDPRTGALMTLDDWQRYLAEFMEEIRAALPQIEIAHNVLWNVATPDNDNVFVDRQIDAADYITLERGASDPGLTGGNGEYSFDAFVGFLDYIHTRGSNLILMDEAKTPVQRELALAGWFLVSDGSDLMSSENLDWVAPDTWWHGYDLDLGAATGAHYEWNTLLRRDFDCGLVLLNRPGMPSVSVDLGEFVTTLENVPVSSVTLEAATGAVLLKPCVAVERVIDTTPFVSTDPSGLSFLPTNGTLLISDSEVDETALFAGFNVFESTLAGMLVGQSETTGFSDEPSGVAYNTVTGTLFIVDDDTRMLFEIDSATPVPQLISSVSLTGSGLTDPEGISFSPDTGNLYVVDGADGTGGTGTIFELNPAGGLVSTLYIGNIAQDPEGIYFDLIRGSFFVVSGSDDLIFEISTAGELIAAYDIQPVEDAFGYLRANGVTLAPSSDPDDDPAARNLYFADQGYDEINDGRVFEISLNHPPVGDADADAVPDSIDNCTNLANTAQIDTDADGIGNRCDADTNNDCLVNFADLAALKAGFFPLNNPEVDFTGDGFVNFADLAFLKSTMFNAATPGPGPGAPGNVCE